MYGEGVDTVYSIAMLIVPFNKKEFQKDWVTVFTEEKAGYFYQTVPRPPEIFTSLLHICDLRSRTTIEKLFSIEVPPYITAIETSHKQRM